MLVPLSWLREHVDIPADLSARRISDALITLGLEVERVETPGSDLTGPVVFGRVTQIEELTGFKKPIRWCQVDVGEGTRGIVCGASNFAAGDTVVVALPGSVLPGGFAITARRTYGHVSDGMICSARELGIGEDHTGILVVPGEHRLGTDAIDELGLRDEVFDIAVGADRGYCLSIRGVAREASHAFGTAFRDVAGDRLDPDQTGWPVRIDDPSGCDRFSARTVTGIDPAAPTPMWMRTRLARAGMRPISLAVDVTNYVMLETGQPMHAFDRSALRGPLVVRRANAGERLTTLDGVDRELDPDDLLVAHDDGPAALAGVMGGESTEISATTTDVVLEAAHWEPTTIARSVRRHKLPSEAARRFERDVDPEIALVALARAAALLTEYGGGRAEAGLTVVGEPYRAPTIELAADRPERTAGRAIDPDTVVESLRRIGCAVSGTDQLTVRPPSWRPDLTDPADLVEEVVRLVGYDTIPETLPRAPLGHGLTQAQRVRRSVGRALAGAGYVEVLTYPFIAPDVGDALNLPEDDPRRDAIRLVNPLSREEPDLRTSLLPGLFQTLARNLGRGQRDLALYEIGLVYRVTGRRGPAPVVGVDARPNGDQLDALDALLPAQPRRVATVLTGAWEPDGWWGAGRPVSWADAIESARIVAGVARVELSVRADVHAPWHPGRCAALVADDHLVGHAGELHPRVIAAFDLPERTCAMELDLDALGIGEPPLGPVLSGFPPALMDVALVVDETVPAAAVEGALRDGGGELLESVRLFDVYSGAQTGEGRRSLAFGLRMRAPDRTLTAEEANRVRDAAVAEASRRHGVTVRS